MSEKKVIGQNVETEVEGSILTIKIDLSKDFGPSASGKTIIIATTSGNQRITDEATLGLNLYRKNPKYVPA
jgi:hypothetical protein